MKILLITLFTTDLGVSEGAPVGEDDGDSVGDGVGALVVGTAVGGNVGGSVGAGLVRTTGAASVGGFFWLVKTLSSTLDATSVASVTDVMSSSSFNASITSVSVSDEFMAS